MDLLSPLGCYRTRARIFKDSDNLLWLRWFWVPTATPFLPSPHSFISRVWETEKDVNWLGIGEHNWRERVRDRGLPPLGDNRVAGSPEDFLEGQLLGDTLTQDPSECCGPNDDSDLACYTGSPACPVMPRLWELIVPLDPDTGPESVYLTPEVGSRFSNAGWDHCSKCPCMPKVWYVEYDGPCNVPGPQWMIARDKCVFSSCTPASPI
jgi:hypothetical protein